MRYGMAILGILLLGPTLAAEEHGLRVMTFNIRYDTASDGENAWPQRRDWVAEIVREQKVDLLGVQEALARQIADLESRLPEYAWLGAGRDDGRSRGEYVPLFWRKERFEALDQGHFWLSTTPDRPGSRDWDAAITRMVTWAKLKDKQSGQTLLVANTHFDHRGAEARRESAKLLLRKLPELAGDLPVILTGDFNTTPSSEPYAILTGRDAAADAWRLVDTRAASRTKPQGPNSTWNGFTRIVPDQQIDFILTRGLATHSHAILETVRDGKFASDHLPVLAELSPVEK
jgi:endonuclease/exonuclease/phosphatase family metal-dependent hydrolase